MIVSFVIMSLYLYLFLVPTTIIMQQQSRLEAQIGSTVDFPCLVNHSNLASLSIKWKKDGNIIMNNNHTNLTKIDHGVTLIIDSVSHEDDGQYQCFISTTVDLITVPYVHSTINFTTTGI